MRPVDVVVIILSIVIFLSVAVPLIGQAINHDIFTENRAETLTQIIIGIMSIIALYVGAKLNRKDDE